MSRYISYIITEDETIYNYLNINCNYILERELKSGEIWLDFYTNDKIDFSLNGRYIKKIVYMER